MWRHPRGGQGTERRRDPRLETCCDDTCAAVLDERGRSARRSLLPGRAARPLRRRRSRGRVAAAPRPGHPGDRGGPRPRRGDPRRLDRVAVTQGPGLIGALLVGLAAAKASRTRAAVPLVPVDHLHGHVAALSRPSRPSRRSCACWPPAATRCCSTCTPAASCGCSAGRSTTPPARRSTRARACSACLPRRPGARGSWPAAAIRLRSRSRGRWPAARACDLSFSGLKTALARRLSRRARATPADLAASYQEAIVETPRRRARVRRSTDRACRLGVVGGVAANGPLRRPWRRVRAPRNRAPLRTTGVLRGQRGHDRRRRRLPGADRVSRLPRDRRSCESQRHGQSL